MTRTTKVNKRKLFGILRYEPHAGQQKVHDSAASRRVLACGVRWGKSTAAAMEAAAALLAPAERALGWVVAPTFDLTDRVFAPVVAAIEARFEHRVLELDLRERKLVVQNLGGGRSELRGKSADRPVTLLGEGVDWMIVDEAARLDASVWNEYLSARLVDRDGWALLLSTPRGDNWFLEVFRYGGRWRRPDWESWQSPSSENPLLDPAVIETQRATLSPDAFNEQFEACFLGAGPERCSRCGNPSESARGLVIIAGSGEPSTCTVCAGIVDELGKTAVRLNSNGTLRMDVERWPVEYFSHEFVFVPRGKVLLLPWRVHPLTGAPEVRIDPEVESQLPSSRPIVPPGYRNDTSESMRGASPRL